MSWIKWNGGQCPVPEGTPVKVRLRSQEERGPYPAESLVWGRWIDSKADRDIIAYRVEIA